MSRLLVILAFAACSLLALGCEKDNPDTARAITGGDPHKGRDAIRHYGCTSCHSIPGILPADSLVGPPLDRIASRTYIAGVIPNSPTNMVRWLQNPPAVDPQTAMPNMHITPSDARDIASYLYTLK